MKTTTQYQPNWSENNVPRPREVMWMEPETPLDQRTLDKLVKDYPNAGWTGFGIKMVIMSFYDR